MEQRSAAAFGESPSSDEEDDFGEGYEAGARLLTVREDDLQQDQPKLRVTRGQRRLAGDLEITAKCKKKMVWKTRELLYDLFQADTEHEVVKAFEKCNDVKIKERKVKPFDIEKIYKQVD